MNAVWKVTHDPLRLTEPGLVAARFDAKAREQGEDIIQAECVAPQKKTRIADLGWVRDHYVVFLVEDADWEAPLQKIECRDLEGALAAFRTLTAR